MMLLDLMHINYGNAARLMSFSPNHFNCPNRIMGAHTYDDAISNLPAERAGEECRKRYLAWAEAAAVGAHGCVWAIDGECALSIRISKQSMAAPIGLVSDFHTILSTPATVPAQPHCMCFTDDQWLHQNVGKWFVQLIPSASCAHSGFALCAFPHSADSHRTEISARDGKIVCAHSARKYLCTTFGNTQCQR